MKYTKLHQLNKESEASVRPSQGPRPELPKFEQAWDKYGMFGACNGLPLSSADSPTGMDYSEEALPERDPAYRLPDGTLSEGQTVEEMPSHVRQELARRLEQLGMNPAKAAMVASL
jgi:hypothetical protein